MSDATMSDALIVRLERDNARLRKANSELRKVKNALAYQAGGLDEFLDDYRKVITDEENFKFKAATVKQPVAQDPKHEEVAAVAFSDLHLSETVRLSESNGINQYNSIIAANRVYEYAQKVKSILTRHMAMYKIKSIWVPVLGDIINGSIHPELIATNDMTDPAAVVLGARLLRMFVEELASLGVPVEVDAIHGNHPRLSAKMPTKKQAHTNLDWLMYEYMSSAFERDSRVSVNVHTSQIGMKNILGWNYVFEHGIDVASGKEEAFEDRIRALFDDQVYRKATGYKGASFDQLLIGNMHKAKFLERTIVNGTFTGQNELGMSWRLKPITASQSMWGISKSHVRTWQYQIDLGHVVSTKPTNPFSDYAAWFIARSV